MTQSEAVDEATRYGLNVADIGIRTSISYDALVWRFIICIKSGL